MSVSDRNQFEYPDEAAYPDGIGTLNQDQTGLVDEIIEDSHALEIDSHLVNDDTNGVYEAIVGDTEIAGVPYNVASDGRVVLLGTSVYPQYRNQGVDTELIRRVLDDMRTQATTVIVPLPGRAHVHRAQPRLRRPGRPEKHRRRETGRRRSWRMRPPSIRSNENDV